MSKIGYKKFLAHHHTGKIRHHKHTSFMGLAVILLIAFVSLLSASHVLVSADATDPVSDSFSTYAVVPGTAPTVAPSITNQSNGRIYTIDDVVVIRGTCPADSLVKIFKNEVFAGAALCKNGTYQVPIDLFIGNNSLIARAYNNNDAVSPDSTPVSVQLVLPGSKIVSGDQLNVLGAPAGQFYMTSEISHRGANAGDKMTWSLLLAGGTAPYAVSISWGDGKTELVSRGADGKFDISHIYAEANGTSSSYTIVVRATDQEGNRALIQLVAIVSSNHEVGIVGSVKDGYNWSSPLRIGWQLLAVSVVVGLSFWLGEKREMYIIRSLKKRAA